MSKVTSKLQVTIPKTLAVAFGIRPGDEIQWDGAADAIRLTPAALAHAPLARETRARYFDQATQRQQQRQRGQPSAPAAAGRGWKREDLYRRGRPH